MYWIENMKALKKITINDRVESAFVVLVRLNDSLKDRLLLTKQNVFSW